MTRTELLNQMKELTKGNEWQADLLTKIDSDPRFEALIVLNRGKAAASQIVWNWEKTDFNGNPEPIVIEFSPYKNEDLVSKKEVKEALNKLGVKYASSARLLIV